MEIFELARRARRRNVNGPILHAHVAELADAYGSGPYGATRGGSSPLVSRSGRRKGCGLSSQRRWPVVATEILRQAQDDKCLNGFNAAKSRVRSGAVGRV